MKLIVHLGLHKTGSTFFQHIMNDYSDRFVDHGLYYHPQDGYPAHHAAAWQLLRGDPQPLAAMIAQARDARCDRVLLSSEDLEGALYDRRAIDAILTAASDGAVESIEWHVTLREPGSAFASLFAQLQHHVYADAVSLFYDVMRRGFIHIDQPMPDAGTPYWYYSFDHHRDLERLAEWTGEAPMVQSFDDRSPFPAWRILARERLIDLVDVMPGDDARNRRLEPLDVGRGYVERMLEAVPSEQDQEAIIEPLTDCLRAGLDHIDKFARIVGERWGESHQRAIKAFGLG